MGMNGISPNSKIKSYRDVDGLPNVVDDPLSADQMLIDSVNWIETDSKSQRKFPSIRAADTRDKEIYYPKDFSASHVHE